MGVQYDYIQICNDSYVDRAKNAMVHEFLKSDFTHLMIIDSDETWDFVGFARIVKAAAAGCEIVAGLYPCKNRWENFGGLHKEDENGQVMGFETPDMRLLEMEYVPGGFIIYSRQAFERTRSNLDSYIAPETDEEILECFRCNIEFGLPKFTAAELQEMNKETLIRWVLANQRGGRKGGRTGEDIYFQKRYQEMGGKIWCEPNIDIGHWGVKEWKGNYHEHLLGTRKFGQEVKECA